MSSKRKKAEQVEVEWTGPELLAWIHWAQVQLEREIAVELRSMGFTREGKRL